MTKFEIVSEKEQQKGVMSGFLALYLSRMLSRSSRGRPLNAPAAFIHPCQPAAVAIPLYTVRNIDSGAGPYR
jgi:hypothetical protein